MIRPLGYQQMTSLSTSSAVGLQGIPSSEQVQLTIIAVEGAGIRWRDDGTDPTSTVGMPVNAGQTLPYVGDPSKIKIIGQASGATVNVSYNRGR